MTCPHPVTNCSECGDVLIHQTDRGPRLEFAEIGELPWPTAGDDLLSKGLDRWMNACLGWSLDEWSTYAVGYHKAARLIVEHIATSRGDQDFLVWPFMMCWRHHVELQLKRLNRFLRELLQKPSKKELAHSIPDLWSDFRRLTEEAGYGPSSEELDNVQGVLDQLDYLDPNSQAFRYPVSHTGKPSRPNDLTHLNLGRFHEIMERQAYFLNGCDFALQEQLEECNATSQE